MIANRERVIIGCDPGANTGVAVLRIEPTLAVVAHKTITAPARKPTQRHAENDVAFFERIRAYLSDVGATYDVTAIAIEEPCDARAYWGGIKHTAVGTQFRVGAAFGLLLAAASTVTPHVYTYPVRDHDGRRGWTRNKPGKAFKPWLFQLWEAVTGKARSTEHVRMAFGVALYHLDVTSKVRAAKYFGP